MISNTASKENIEQSLQAKFDFGFIYKPQSIINGHKESTLCIVTTQAINRIQYGIWGILPNGYRDSWNIFQSTYNTLEIEFESISEISWLYESLKYRRCLIIATGYYTAEIENQSLQSFHNILKTRNLFCFAGIYNILDDGFISCSILTHTNGSSNYLLKNPKPIIIKQENYTNYLKRETSITDMFDSNYEINPDEFLKCRILQYSHQS